jgi:peroxiredoxin
MFIFMNNEETWVLNLYVLTQQHILGFATDQKMILFFSTMFIITCSQNLLCSYKEHQDVMCHHGFVTVVNMTTCSIFG